MTVRVALLHRKALIMDKINLEPCEAAIDEAYTPTDVFRRAVGHCIETCVMPRLEAEEA